MTKLENIPIEFDLVPMLGSLHLEAGSKESAEFEELLEQARAVVNPKVLYVTSCVEKSGPASVQVDGVTFSSRVLTVNLECAERVFPYIATCGRELDTIDTDYDMLKQYWLDEIKAKALIVAVQELYRHIDEHYDPGKLSTMNPGSSSADVWPIEQQKELFSIFGDAEALIGVRLTDSCLMIPNKTISGILFPATNNFESCQLCQKETCKGRRAPYDPELVRKYAEEE